MELIKLFKSLADESRLRIIRLLLKGSFNVKEILFVIGGKQSNISHHLKILLDNEIVINKKEGSQIYYGINEKLNDPALQKILTLIDDKYTDINEYMEDTQRLNFVLEKRKKEAEEYFHFIDEGNYKEHADVFEQIYDVSDYINYFESNCPIVLDLGCGSGKNLALLSKYSDKVIGFDRSPKMLQLSEHICMQNNINYELKLGNINNLPFKDNSINGIFINMVLHHLSDPGIALIEASRILSENGKLLLFEFLEHNDDAMRERFNDLWLGFGSDKLINWIDNAGFIIEKAVKKEDPAHPVIIIMAKKAAKMPK